MQNVFPPSLIIELCDSTSVTLPPHVYYKLVQMSLILLYDCFPKVCVCVLCVVCEGGKEGEKEGEGGGHVSQRCPIHSTLFGRSCGVTENTNVRKKKEDMNINNTYVL